jgi:hypothetical protein
MTKDEFDNLWKSDFKKLENIIKGNLSGREWDNMISLTYIHLYNNLDKIKNRDDFFNWLINYSKKWWWDGSDYLYEMGDFKKYLKWRELDVIPVEEFEDIEDSPTEYCNKLDSSMDSLEKNLKMMPYEYKILFTLIFKDGKVSNKELSEILNTEQSSIISLKRKLKGYLNVDSKKHWRKNEIKNIWKDL